MLLVIEGIQAFSILDHATAVDKLEKQIIVSLKQVNHSKASQEDST
jgi:hypothetical protein